MTTAPHNIPELANHLGQAFGPLDSEIVKWEAQAAKLQTFFPTIEAALQHHFSIDRMPMVTFRGGVGRYTDLLAELKAAVAPPEVVAAGIGFLNLRMFLLTNSFLLAVGASLQAEAYIDQVHAIGKIEKSDFAPYFFERLTMNTTEVIVMLEADLAQLQAAPRDKKARLVAMRVRNGIYATLAEEYCPVHPLVYYPLWQLNQIKNSADEGMIDLVIQAVADLVGAIRQGI